MPSRKRNDGTYQDVAHPVNNKMRQRIEARILSEYAKEQARLEAGETSYSATEEH